MTSTHCRASSLLYLAALFAAAPASADGGPTCDELEAAIVSTPRDVPTMIALGRCAEDRGKVATAFAWYRKAQATSVELADPAAEQQAAARATAIGDLVPAIALRVDGTPGVIVEVDGSRIAASSYGRIELDPGTHEIVARAPGKATSRHTVRLAEYARETIDIALVPSTPSFVDDGRFRRRTGIVLATSGAALFAGMVAYGFVEKSRYEDPAATREDQNDARTRLRYIGTGSLLLSATAITTGLALFFTAPDRRLVSEESALSPAIGDGHVGVTMSGRF